MNELYIMRHGETEWNRQKRYQGQMDSALTETGKQGTLLQKARIGDLKFKAVYCSPLGRTRSTLRLLSPQCDDVVFDDRLKEICLGRLQGKTHLELEDLEQAAQEQFWSNPEHFHIEGAETMDELEMRVSGFLSDLKNTEGRILMITHTVIIKMILKILDSRPMEKLWDEPYLHPGTIIVVSKEQTPCIQKVIHTHKDMTEPESYTA